MNEVHLTCHLPIGLGISVAAAIIPPPPRGLSHHLYLARIYPSFLPTQPIVTCKWQPAQLSVTCECHYQHNFHAKKLCEICFKKQAAFLSFA